MFKYLETIFISLVKEIYGNISKNWGMFFAAVTIVTFSFFVLQLVMIVYFNLENIKQKLFSQISIHVYLKKETTVKDINSFIYNLENNDKILSTIVLSKEEFLKKVSSNLNLKDLDIPIGNVVYVKVKDPKDVEIVASQLRNYPIVKDVLFWQEYVKNLTNIFNIIKNSLFGIVFILVIGVILIINSTVKMSILSRRNEIKIMTLVGATGWFIKTPIFSEVIIVIIISLFVSHYFIRIAYSYLLDKFNYQLSFISLLPVDYLIYIRNMLFFLSIVISFIFVYTTIEKYLKKLSEDE
jgi:cell division transport system permease protein